MHALLGHARQRHGAATVMHNDTAEHGRQGHATVGRVYVQLKAVPAVLVALGVALGVPIAMAGDVGQHLRRGLHLLNQSSTGTFNFLLAT
jgi:hypothetical protein